MKVKNAPKSRLKISRDELDQLSNKINDQFNRDGKIALEGRSARTLVACLNSLAVILDMLSKARMRIGAVRKLFGLKPEESGDKDDREDDCGGEGLKGNPEVSGTSGPSSGDAPNDPLQSGESSDPATDSEAEASPDIEASAANSTNLGSDLPCDSTSSSSDAGPVGDPRDDRKSKHGPNHAAEYPNAKRVDCSVPGLSKGDDCPREDCNGRLYSHQPVDSPRQLVVFDAQASFEPTIYSLNDLQCNSCKTLFKAELPTKLVEQGIKRGSGRQYTFQFLAYLLVAHYYFGRSFRSADQLNSMIGYRIADSTLNSKALEQRSYLGLLCERLTKIAADCLVLYGDDIGSKVIPLIPQIKKSRNGEYTCRNGIYTSIIIGVTGEGLPIPIFNTGMHHLGETFDKVLALRDSALQDPVVIRDQSSSNKITVCSTISAGCLQHTREYFVKAHKNYPNECKLVLDKISQIFKVDRKTHDLPPNDRLNMLKTQALPIMDDILSIVIDMIEAKIATPSSDLGAALEYFKKYYPSMMIPYQVPGIGLTNNLSEWMTYPVVRYLNNSRHYASEDGAQTGDNVVTLVMLALLANRNPIRYLEYLLANKHKIEAHPSEPFLPADFSKELVPELAQNWFTNWIPRPEASAPQGNPAIESCSR